MNSKNKREKPWNREEKCEEDLNLVADIIHAGKMTSEIKMLPCFKQS